MSRETIVVAFDDLDGARGERVEATAARTISYRGKVVELDLTAAHAKELDELLAPYLAAGANVAPPVTTKMSRAYTAAMRAFATERGLSYKTKPGSGIYYSAELRQAFADHVRATGQRFDDD